MLGPMDVRPRVIIGSTTHGCYLLPEPFSVMHAGQGTCSLAEVDASLPKLTDTAHSYM